MAYGTELFLGFANPEMLDIVAQLGLTVDLSNDEDREEERVGPENVLEDINAKLKQAYVDCLQNDLHFNLRKRKIQNDGAYPIMETPLGLRELSPWRLDLHFDPDEMGEDQSQAIFGVSLIGRYFPKFLDWANQHGGSGGMVCLNKETMANIEIARKAISTVLPMWEIAHICFKMKHY